MRNFLDVYAFWLLISRTFADQMESSSPIHYAFPWRALTTRLAHYPPACSLYDRSLYSIYGNMLSTMTSQNGAATAGLNNLTLNYLNSAAAAAVTSQSPTNQLSPAGVSTSHEGSTSSAPAIMTSHVNHPAAASLYGAYRYHPYLNLPKV